MKIEYKDMFLDAKKLDYLCITTNAVLKQESTMLVMGAGIAKAALEREPNLSKEFAKALIKKFPNHPYTVFPDYYLLAHGKYIAFQTKRHWSLNSPIELVINSISKLGMLANKYPNKTFGLPFPGCTNGGLKKESILPYLVDLPNNVIVYDRD